MKNIIGAEAARWAGLQIDLHSKFRSGNITPDQLEWWLNQSINTRNAIMGDGRLYVQKPSEKFALLVDLGIITVPDDYDHASRLTTFGNQNCKKFYNYNEAITDKNFPNPTRVLKPGDKLRVRAFKQVAPGTTTSEERMAFLATQNAIHTGAQGASLVWDQKRDQLQKYRWYTSFDDKDHLWTDFDGDYRVPCIYYYYDGDFRFDLAHLKGAWGLDDCFLCFCDVE